MQLDTDLPRFSARVVSRREEILRFGEDEKFWPFRLHEVTIHPT